jgi:hypothetical protein
MTVARHEGFIARAEAGLVNPRSVSRNITPGNGGCATHYGGARVTINSHNDCIRTWRNWQHFHMVTRGWADIAYNLGVCQHGYVFAGRGAHTRSAAQGSNVGNQNYYAICWIGGANMTPTRKAHEAMAWAIREMRRSGGAGSRVRPHSDFNATACPGPNWRAFSIEHDGVTFDEAGGSEAPATDFDRWWDSLDKNKQAVLEALADVILDEGPEGQPEGRRLTPQSLGRSFGRQTYILLRQDRQWIHELDRLVGLKSAGGVANTSLQGVIVGSINAIDAVRDMGYEIDTSKRTGAQPS